MSSEYDGPSPKKRVEFLKSNKEDRFILKIGETAEYFSGYFFKPSAFSPGKMMKNLSKKEYTEVLDYESIDHYQFGTLIGIRQDSEDNEVKLVINGLLRYELRNDNIYQNKLLKEKAVNKVKDNEEEFEFINGYFMTKSGVILKVEQINSVYRTNNSRVQVMIDKHLESYYLTDEEYLFLKDILKGKIKPVDTSF